MDQQPEVKCLFSIPVYETKIDIKKPVLNNLIKTKLEFMEHVGNGHMSKEKNILNNSKYKSLKKIIENNASVYFHEVLQIKRDCKLYIKNSWITKHQTNDYTQIHHHANSIVSAILYLKNTQGTGDLILQRPENNNVLPGNFQFKHYSYNMLNAQAFTIEPSDGLLVIFPSHLKHSAKANLTNLDRYLLSCDFYIKGNIGVNGFELKL